MKIQWNARKRLYLQASAQLANGRALSDILDDFVTRCERRRQMNVAKEVAEISRLVRNGSTFADAIDESLTDLERILLRTGERSGRLDGAMRDIVNQRDRVARILSKTRSAMFAPTIYCIALFATLFVIGNYVVPQFASILPVSSWHGWAFAMYFLGEIATSWYTILVFAIPLLTLVGLYFVLPKYTGKLREFLDQHIFPFTLYRELNGYFWLTSFISLLEAGVSDVKALEDQIRVGNPWLGSRLTPILNALRDGNTLPTAMRSIGYNFPSMEMIEEVEAYSEFKDFTTKFHNVLIENGNEIERRFLKVSGLLASVFSGIMFFAFLVLQLGANQISDLISTTLK